MMKLTRILFRSQRLMNLRLTHRPGICPSDDFKRGDYQSISNALESIDWDTYFNGLEVNDILNRFCDIVESAEGIYTKPLIPWWSQSVADTIKERKRAERRYRRSPDVNDLAQFRRRRAKARYIMRQARRKSWSEYLEKATVHIPTQKIFKMIKKIEGRVIRTPLLALNVGQGGRVQDPRDIAEHLADHYHHVSSDENLDPLFLETRATREEALLNPSLYESMMNEPYNINFTESELDTALKLYKASATGPDEIHYDMVKNLPRSTRLTLLGAFNSVWNSQCSPIIFRGLKPLRFIGKNDLPVRSDTSFIIL